MAMPTTPDSVRLGKELKRRGWTFVGPTTVYAFMQAMGLVNDHFEGCHARPAVERARAALARPRRRMRRERIPLGYVL
jgi:DNA-3-methyladenine glycosylase I